MKRLLVVGVCAAVVSVSGVLVPARVRAQDFTLVTQPGITVFGTGKVMVKPDIARLTIGVQTTDPDASVAAKENAIHANAIITTIKASGVAEKDIQTSGYTTTPVYRYDPPKISNGPMERVLTGYQVTNAVRVTIRKIADVGGIVDATLKDGANEIDSLQYDLNDADMQKAKDESLRLSILDAARKAVVVARASKAGSLFLEAMTENTIGYSQISLSQLSYKGGSAGRTPFSSGELTITANITVRYRIAPGADPRTGNPAYSAGGGK